MVLFVVSRKLELHGLSKMITLLQGDQNRVRSLLCSCLRKYINASDIFLHCLNAEGQFGTESPETYADVITITHASRSGQTRHRRNLFVLLGL